MHTTSTSGLEATTSQIINGRRNHKLTPHESLTMQNSGMYKSIYICIHFKQNTDEDIFFYNKIIIKYIQHSKLN